MDVGDWLRRLGLGEYERAFRDHRIDFDVLSRLTAEDLKELGVVAVGDRHRLLAAIEALAQSPRQPSARQNLPAPGFPGLAERRQLTVMFADLVGSTALSSRLDPEEMRTAIGDCRQACAKAIELENGYVAKYMGDAVLAYFGYPQAHEDDAEQAVRAGLALAEGVSRLRAPDGSPLQVRVGIATGVVVVGDLLGSGEAHERGVVGDTPNLAARLQGIAKPGGVVIAESTRRLLGDLFELEDLGVPELKGIASPPRVYSAIRIRPGTNRFEALHPEGLAPLVGRAEELEMSTRRWTRAKDGDGQALLLSGEPGIGKSRLVAAITTHLQSEPHDFIGWFCSPQHAEKAFYPIARDLERAAQIGRDDDPKTALDKLYGELARRGGGPDDGDVFADLLSLSGGGRHSQSPRERRRRLLDALVEQIEVRSRKAPTLVVLEDAQWADPSSLEVIDRLVDRLERLNVLLIVTYRPEFVAPWIGRPHVAALTLNRMTRADVGALVDVFQEGKILPASARREIVERSGGVPLFAEEMTKAALEALDDAQAPSCSLSLDGQQSAALPSALQASLLSRLDRLGEARDVVQIGAAIGREFSYSLIKEVAELSEADLAAALDRLVRAGLLLRHGAGADAVYAFKHSLCQDVAYGALLREKRRDLHGRIAAALEREGADASPRADVLARHTEQSGDLEKAAAMWERVGRLALDRSELAEAALQLQRALALIESVPPSPSADALRRTVKSQLAELPASARGDGTASV